MAVVILDRRVFDYSDQLSPITVSVLPTILLCEANFVILDVQTYQDFIQESSIPSKTPQVEEEEALLSSSASRVLEFCTELLWCFAMSFRMSKVN